MATKKTTTEENIITGKKASVKAITTAADAKLIIAPRVTEKASLQSNANAYTFVVAKHATKLNLMDEIKKEYKVTPRAINITNLPRRNVFVRGKLGTQTGIKKAIVFLKKGDTIKLA